MKRLVAALLLLLLLSGCIDFVGDRPGALAAGYTYIWAYSLGGDWIIRVEFPDVGVKP